MYFTLSRLSEVLRVPIDMKVGTQYDVATRFVVVVAVELQVTPLFLLVAL